MSSNVELSGLETVSKPAQRRLKTIAKGGLISLLGVVSFMLINLIFQWVQARTLGPSGVGIVGLGVSVVSLAIIFARFGLTRSILRYVAHFDRKKDQEKITETIVGAFTIFVIMAFVTTTILYVGSEFIAQDIFNEPELTPVLRVLALSIPFTGVMILLMAIAQAFKRVEYQATIEKFIVPLLKVIVAVGLIYLVSRSPLVVAYAILFSAIVGAILAVVSVWRLHPIRLQNVRKIKIASIIGILLSFSWPLFLTEILNRSEGQIGILMLGWLSSSAEVGVYKIGFRITVLMTLFLVALNTIFAPIIADLFTSGDRGELSRLYKTVTKWSLIFSIPIFIVLFTQSSEILFIFGPKFVEGSQVLRVLAVAQFMFVITGPSGWMLTMTGHPRMNLLNAGLTLGVIIGLDILLIPRFGALGSAFGKAISILAINLLRLTEVYIILRFHPYKWSYYKPITAGVLAALGVIIAQQFIPGMLPILRIVILSLIVFAIYIMVLVALRLDEEDQLIIKSIQQHLRTLITNGANS